MSLNDLANRMRSAGNDSYDFDDEQVQEALQTLSNEFDNATREQLRAIMVEGDFPSGASTISEAVKAVTSENDIKSTFTQQWDNDVLRAIQYELKDQYNQIWENADEEIAEIKQMFRDADISNLNEMCAETRYNDVYEEVGEPDRFDTPSTYAECTSMVAKVQGIKDDLTDAYIA